jgi:hypothetical protein
MCNVLFLELYKVATFVSIPFPGANARSPIPPTPIFVFIYSKKILPLESEIGFQCQKPGNGLKSAVSGPNQILLKCAVKGTSNALQLGLSVATSVPASNILSFATIIILYCVVFVLNTICLILEYSQAIKWQRRNATSAMVVSVEREDRLLSFY